MFTTGDRIKKARLEKRMTQQELADKVGVKFSAIHKYEAGIVVNIKRDMIDALAKALDVKPSYLLCMDEDDAEFVASLGALKPLEQLSEDEDALNVLLYDLGERIIKVDGIYYLGVCGPISQNDIAFLKSSATSGLKIAYEALKNRAESKMRNDLSGKK